MSLINLTCTKLGYCTPPLLNSEHFILILLSCLGTGVLLAFTPCVLPMVPVVSSIIVGQKTNLSMRRGLLLAISYVLGMAVVYALLGGLVALGGQHIQLYLQKPWVLVVFSGILALMSIWLLDIFSFPNFNLSIRKWIRLRSRGTILAAFLLGAASIMILSPCVTPAMVGILGLIGRKGDVFLGALALFCVAIGMGAPLLIVGISAGKWLPRTGSWMVWIKKALGVGLLIIALSLMKNAIFPEKLTSVTSLEQINQVLQIAMQNKQPLVLDFYASWCQSCKILKQRLERYEPILKKNALWITVDISDMNASIEQILTKYKVDGPPTILFFTPEGNIYRKIVGIVSAQDILNALKAAAQSTDGQYQVTIPFSSE